MQFAFLILAFRNLSGTYPLCWKRKLSKTGTWYIILLDLNAWWSHFSCLIGSNSGLIFLIPLMSMLVNTELSFKQTVQFAFSILFNTMTFTFLLISAMDWFLSYVTFGHLYINVDPLPMCISVKLWLLQLVLLFKSLSKPNPLISQCSVPKNQGNFLVI